MNENHFPQLLEAAKRIVIDEEVYFASLPIDEIQAIVEANRETIDELKRVLQQPCSMQRPEDDKAFCKSIDFYVTLRAASKILSLASRLEFERHHFLEAMENAACMFRLANIMRQDGLVVDMLAANAIEGTAIYTLRKQRHNFDQQSREHLTKLLRNHVAAREDFDFIAARDAAWEAAQEPEVCELTFDEEDAAKLTPEAIEHLKAHAKYVDSLPSNVRLKQFESADANTMALQRLLWLEILLLDYRETQSCYPSELSEAVSAADSDILIDPFSKQQFCYRTDEDGFVLYSVGPKQFDAGGKFGHLLEVNSHLADLCLDAADYPFPENVCFRDSYPNFPQPAPPPTLLQRTVLFFKRIGRWPKFVSR